jgi:hypothetical protein
MWCLNEVGKSSFLFLRWLNPIETVPKEWNLSRFFHLLTNKDPRLPNLSTNVILNTSDDGASRRNCWVFLDTRRTPKTQQSWLLNWPCPPPPLPNLGSNCNIVWRHDPQTQRINYFLKLMTRQIFIVYHLRHGTLSNLLWSLQKPYNLPSRWRSNGLCKIAFLKWMNYFRKYIHSRGNRVWIHDSS